MDKRVSKSATHRVSYALLILAAGLLVNVARAQKLPWQDTPEAGNKTPQTVRFAGPDQIEIAAGKPQVVELHFKIQDGFHINSHTPHEKTLIPTQLMVVDGDGVNVTGVDFPPGTDTSFVFAPNEKVSVYTGSVMLRAHMTVAPGGHLLQGALRYQACDANECMPPRKIPVAISLLAK
jgi:cytochrome c biogenesis DsbD-like protein